MYFEKPDASTCIFPVKLFLVNMTAGTETLEKLFSLCKDLFEHHCCQ